MRKPKRSAPGGGALANVLGSLQLQVMEAVWDLGPDARVTIREVSDAIGAHRTISFNTVMTVMNRLVDKGLLRRRAGAGRRHYYRARFDRGELERRVSSQLAERLVRDFGSTAVAQFVDALDRIDPDRLSELERLLRRRHGGSGT